MKKHLGKEVITENVLTFCGRYYDRLDDSLLPHSIWHWEVYKEERCKRCEVAERAS